MQPQRQRAQPQREPHDDGCAWPPPEDDRQLANHTCAPLAARLGARISGDGGISANDDNNTTDAAADEAIRSARRERIRAELDVLYPRFDAAGASAAYQNLRYGSNNETLLGLRVQIVQRRIFFTPVPPDLERAVYERPWDRAWLPYTVGALVMLSNVVARHPVPDVTLVYGDACFELDAHGRDAEHRHHRGGSLLRLPPVLSYNTRPECHAVTFPSFDFMFSDQNFLPGSTWRFDSYPAPAWAGRRPTLLFRGGISSWDGLRLRVFRAGLLADGDGLLDIRSSHWACEADCNERYEAAVRAYGGPVRGSVQADCGAVCVPAALSPQEQLAFKYSSSTPTATGRRSG